MSVYGLEAMQSWTDSRLAAVTHAVVPAADLRLYGDQVDVVWTPDLHVVNARRRLTADRHRVLAISTAGLVILHHRYIDELHALHRCRRSTRHGLKSCDEFTVPCE